MAVDPNWVRENPEEAARQLDVLGDMHVDHVRHLWESRGFGGCVEFAEAFDALVQQKKLLIDTCNMGADLADHIELLTRERDQYRAAEEAQIALREKAAQRVEELTALCNAAGDEIIKAGERFLELDGRIEFLNKQNTAQQEQNDELAAYAEEAKQLVQELAAYTGSNRVYGWLEKETPAKSIARRDLIKQAEALSALAERKDKDAESEEDAGLKRKCAYAAVCAANESNRLRRIAQGGA